MPSVEVFKKRGDRKVFLHYCSRSSSNERLLDTWSSLGKKKYYSSFACKKCGILPCKAGEKIVRHKALANPAEQPALCRYFENWEAYFKQPKNEYSRWLRTVKNEAMSMAIDYLLKIAENNGEHIRGESIILMPALIP